MSAAGGLNTPGSAPDGIRAPGVLVSHPTGNAFNRALLRTAEERNQLAGFCTTLWVDSSGIFSHPVLRLMGAAARRRSFPLPASRMTGRCTREALRLMAGATGLRWLTRHETGWASVDAVYRDLDASVACCVEQKKPAAVYAYEDGARDTFRAAARLGIPAVYDLPIAHWRAMRSILEEEARRRPDWEPTLLSTRDSPGKLRRKDEELALASGIVVPSRFVADSLPDFVKNTPVHVAPFGSPFVPPVLRRHGAGGARLRVLFAGSMSQRKGLADVFEAMKLLKRRDVELVVMGSPVMPMSFYRADYPDFIHEPTRSHDEVLRLMANCDVLVLHSLVEGRALVQQEALACGLPLIVTRNAGGEDLVEEGRTGFLVPVRCAEGIAGRISWFADHRDALSSMREMCADKAATYLWDGYATGILEFVQGLIARFQSVGATRIPRAS